MRKIISTILAIVLTVLLSVIMTAGNAQETGSHLCNPKTHKVSDMLYKFKFAYADLYDWKKKTYGGEVKIWTKMTLFIDLDGTGSLTLENRTSIDLFIIESCYHDKERYRINAYDSDGNNTPLEMALNLRDNLVYDFEIYESSSNTTLIFY
mgnify:FL=1